MAEGTTVFLCPRGCAHANNSGCTHARTSTAMPYSLDNSGQRHTSANCSAVHSTSQANGTTCTCTGSRHSGLTSPRRKPPGNKYTRAASISVSAEVQGEKTRRASNSVSAEVRASGTQAKRSSNRIQLRLSRGAKRGGSPARIQLWQAGVRAGQFLLSLSTTTSSPYFASSSSSDSNSSTKPASRILWTFASA